MASKYLRTIYLYCVSFLALMALIAGTVNLVNRIATYILPTEYNYSTTYDYKYNNNDEDSLSYDKRVQIETLKEIFTSLAVVIIAVPLYGYHWNMIQKERKGEQE